jgi:hypothetical protein
METGKSKLENGNWKIENRKSKIDIHARGTAGGPYSAFRLDLDPALDSPALQSLSSIFQFQISSFDFRVSSFDFQIAGFYPPRA